MLSHDLAKMLLSLPNLPVATHANNHTFLPTLLSVTHKSESLQVCKISTYAGEHILLGNFHSSDPAELFVK